MEYFAGAAIAMCCYMIANRVFQKNLSNITSDKSSIVYTQSHIYEMIRPFKDLLAPMPEEISRQSSNYIKNIYMKIMVVKDKAYWIKDNKFLIADIVNGEVDKESAKEVDTMGMNKVELNEMLFIVESLRGDSNDSRGSGQ